MEARVTFSMKLWAFGKVSATCAGIPCQLHLVDEGHYEARANARWSFPGGLQWRVDGQGGGALWAAFPVQGTAICLRYETVMRFKTRRGIARYHACFLPRLHMVNSFEARTLAPPGLRPWLQLLEICGLHSALPKKRSRPSTCEARRGSFFHGFFPLLLGLPHWKPPVSRG